MQYIKKDITTVTTGIVLHSVNCQGVMGSGVALAIKRKWPQAFQSYLEFCDTESISETSPHIHDTSLLLGKVNMVEVSDNLFVANLFGQQFYGNDGKTYASPFAFTVGVADVFWIADEHNLPIYTVKIGSVRGGLNWDKDVAPIFEANELWYPLVPVWVCDV